MIISNSPYEPLFKSPQVHPEEKLDSKASKVSKPSKHHRLPIPKSLRKTPDPVAYYFERPVSNSPSPSPSPSPLQQVILNRNDLALFSGNFDIPASLSKSPKKHKSLNSKNSKNSSKLSKSPKK